MTEVSMDDNDEWMQYYQSEFPMIVRKYLTNIFDNWNLLLEQYDNEGIAKLIILELKSKADELPYNGTNDVIRKEINHFIEKLSEMELFRLCERYRRSENRNLENRSDFRQSFIQNFRREMKNADTEKNNLIEELKLTLNLRYPTEPLLQRIYKYRHQTLPTLVEEVSKIDRFVAESKSLLQNYQFMESSYLSDFVNELQESWSSLLQSIVLLTQLTQGFFDEFHPLLQNSSASSDAQLWMVINKEPLYNALDSLISNAMIITESPSWCERSLRTQKKKFSMKLQILMPFNSLSSDTMTVEAYLLTEDGYVRLKDKSCGESILDSDLAVKELYQPVKDIRKDNNAKIYEVNFTELGCKEKIIRDKRKKEQVMSLKYIYLFRSELKCSNGKSVWSRCFSLPVTISTHNDQNIEGSHAIFWDTHYRVPNAHGLETREDVSWSDLSRKLSAMILKMTDRRPTPCNMKFLRTLFLGNRGAEVTDVTDDDEGQFSQKDLLRHIDDDNNSPTFWEWLMHSVYALKDKNSVVGSLWRKGYFVGYIDQQTATCAIETALSTVIGDGSRNIFLLRFSRRDGNDIVAQGYIEGRKKPGIYSIDPYKPDTLIEIPLPHRIMSRDDCQKLLYESSKKFGWAFEDKYLIFKDYLKKEMDKPLPSGYVARQIVEFTPKEEVQEEFVHEQIQQDDF